MPRDDRGGFSVADLTSLFSGSVADASAPSADYSKEKNLRGILDQGSIKISDAEQQQLNVVEQAVAAALASGKKLSGAELTALAETAANGGQPVTTPTVSTIKKAPAVPVAGLSSLESMYADITRKLPGLMGALGAANAGQQAAGATQVAAINAQGDAAAAHAKLEAEQTIATEELQRELLRKIGLDVQDPASALSQELETAASARKRREQLHGKIAELQGINFFADPIGYFAAIPELQSLISQHNQQVTIENTADERVKEMQSLATTIKSVTPATSADLLRAKAEQKAKFDANVAAAKAAEQSERSFAANAKHMVEMLNIENQAFHNYLGLKQFEGTLEERQVRRDERAEKMLKAVEEKNAMEEYVAMVNSHRRMIGNKQDYTVASFKALPKKQQLFWAAIVDSGGYGAHYIDSLPRIEQLGSAGMAAESGNSALASTARNLEMQVRALMPSVEAELRKAGGPLGQKPDPKAVRELAYDKLWKMHTGMAEKQGDKSLLARDIGNPYMIDYDAAASANAQKNNSVIHGLLKLKENSPGRELKGNISDAMVLDTVRAEVVAGTKDPRVAAEEISQFYRSESEKNYMNRGLYIFGLPKVQDYYIVPTGGKSSQKLNLMSAARVESYLVGEVSRRRAADAATNVQIQFGRPVLFR